MQSFSKDELNYVLAKLWDKPIKVDSLPICG